jgi:hypothetical protein
LLFLALHRIEQEGNVVSYEETDLRRKRIPLFLFLAARKPLSSTEKPFKLE